MNARVEIDPWAFWQASLAGGKPETTPGLPHAGFYIAKRYVSLPYGAKRVLCDFPVAIWRDGAVWRSRADDHKTIWSRSELDEVDELFGQVCRNPISHEKYLEMVKTLEAYRNE